jgi:hypothetical protein
MLAALLSDEQQAEPAQLFCAREWVILVPEPTPSASKEHMLAALIVCHTEKSVSDIFCGHCAFMRHGDLIAYAEHETESNCDNLPAAFLAAMETGPITYRIQSAVCV